MSTQRAVLVDEITEEKARVLSSAPGVSDEGLVVRPIFTAGSTPSDVNLVQVGGASIDLGQEAMLSSVPVVIASDQSEIAVGTELPAAALLTDNTANPTVPGVGSFPHWWDSSAWDRAPGNSVDGALVNLGSNNDVIQATHDNFNANANLQVGNTDVANGNPVPVSDAGASLTIDGSVSIVGTPTVDTELPATALLADNTTNPTTTSVGVFTHWFDGFAWDLARGNSTDGCLVNLGSNNDVIQSAHDNFNANANIQVGNSDVSTSNPVPVAGLAADNDVASGNPVRVGGVYNSSDQTYGNGDLADFQFDSQGSLRTAVRRSSSTTLVNNVTYNNSTTTTTSSSVDTNKFRAGRLYYFLDKANTPTDITLTLQGSYDDSNWPNIGFSFAQELVFSDTLVGSGLDEFVDYENLPPYIRLVVVATGTTASNTFTLTAVWDAND